MVGQATGFWSNTYELKANWTESRGREPEWNDQQRTDGLRGLEEGGRAHAELGGGRL